MVAVKTVPSFVLNPGNNSTVLPAEYVAFPLSMAFVAVILLELSFVTTPPFMSSTDEAKVKFVGQVMTVTVPCDRVVLSQFTVQLA